MSHTALFQLAGVIVLGIGAQWIAWRINLPSILLLLLSGILAGPVIGWLNVDQLFGDLLGPFVSLSVALILFEGGMTLRLRELKAVGVVVRNLVTIGALVTWVLAAVAARYVLDIPWSIAALMGAVLIVTGPTVIQPLLRHLRPTGPVGPILKWEGIVIDCIGALAAVLFYEALLIGEAHVAGIHTAMAVVKTVALGGGIGVAAAFLLTFLIARFLVADHLHSAVVLMLVVIAYVAANQFQEEAGLFAVTVMGITLANQKKVDVEQIVAFKENLRVLLISSLFILLSARLDMVSLGAVLWPGLIFCAILIFLVRPASVFASTWGSKLSIRERWFLSGMAPRGIVAAAVASIFALKLENAGLAAADALAPAVFLVIIVTVAFYSLVSPVLGRWMQVAEAQPQGVLFVGAGAWARETAALLHRERFRVLLVDSNWENVQLARMQGLPAYCGSILSERTLEDIDLGGLGRVFAVTPNDLVNSLAVHRLQGLFGSASCYKAAPRKTDSGKDKDHHAKRGRILFREDASIGRLNDLVAEGSKAKATSLSTSFTIDDFRKRYNEAALRMFYVTPKRRLIVIQPNSPMPTQAASVMSLVQETEPKNSEPRPQKGQTEPSASSG